MVGPEVLNEAAGPVGGERAARQLPSMPFGPPIFNCYLQSLLSRNHTSWKKKKNENFVKNMEFVKAYSDS